MYNLGSLFRIHSLKFIPFRLPRFQHHNLPSANVSFGGDLEILGNLAVLFRVDDGSDENRRGLRVPGFMNRLLI